MAAILNSAILNLAFLDSATLVFPLKLTHTCQDWFPPFAQKKPPLIYSDSTWWWQPPWILPCWIQTLPSWIPTPSYLLSDSLKNTLPPPWLLTQTNSIWLKLIHSHSTWWWQPYWILAILESGHLSVSSQTCSHLPRLVPTICTKKPSLIHSDSTWWWFSHLEFYCCWIKKNLLSFILTQLDNGSHLEFYCCWIKKTSLIHSDWSWWWQPSWILPSWIWPSWIQPFLSFSLSNWITLAKIWFPPFDTN